MKNLPGRIARLEGANGHGERCPLCWDRPEALIVRQRGSLDDLQDDGTADMLENDPATLPCPACGWVPALTVITEVVVAGHEQARAVLEIMHEEGQ